MKESCWPLFKKMDWISAPVPIGNTVIRGMLVGYIIQKVSEHDLLPSSRKYIFIPLQMNSSAFDFVHLAAMKKRTGYWCD